MFKLMNKGTGSLFYATTLSAGFDVTANEYKIIEPGDRALIKTGLFMVETLGVQTVEILGAKQKVVPEIQIRPRSGLAVKHGVTVLNTPSTIDADYRGEIMITLINHSKDIFEVKSGDRIAQAVCAFVLQLDCIEVKEVERGTGGFGSTGITS